MSGVFKSENNGKQNLRILVIPELQSGTHGLNSLLDWDPEDQKEFKKKNKDVKYSVGAGTKSWNQPILQMWKVNPRE